MRCSRGSMSGILALSNGSVYLSFSSSFAAASGVDTVLLMRKSLMMPHAMSQYTSMARSVVHSKILPSTRVMRKTLKNGAAKGYETPYTKLLNPAPGLAARSLRTKRKAKITSRIPKIYQTICVPRYNGFVVGELYESICFLITCYLRIALMIQMRTTAPTRATMKLVRLNPVTAAPPPNTWNNQPPKNAPMIPTMMFMPNPCWALVPMTIEAIQPTIAPNTIQRSIFILSVWPLLDSASMIGICRTVQALYTTLIKRSGGHHDAVAPLRAELCDGRRSRYWWNLTTVIFSGLMNCCCHNGNVPQRVFALLSPSRPEMPAV